MPTEPEVWSAMAGENRKAAEAIEAIVKEFEALANAAAVQAYEKRPIQQDIAFALADVISDLEEFVKRQRSEADKHMMMARDSSPQRGRPRKLAPPIPLEEVQYVGTGFEGPPVFMSFYISKLGLRGAKRSVGRPRLHGRQMEESTFLAIEQRRLELASADRPSTISAAIKSLLQEQAAAENRSVTRVTAERFHKVKGLYDRGKRAARGGTKMGE